ncbi:MAG: hypothetical protein LAT50_17685, partial [Ectothiorhodospiraceae bacterium]|nr:hypothetical protein [Ectothiorhodospiraceae bacterium]
MIKAILLGAFFLTVALDEFLALGLLIVTGLSAKNAFLYVLLLAVLCHKVLERTDEGFQFPQTHILFLLLMAYASLTIFFMHFVIGQTSGFGLFGHIASLKGHLVDFYLLFIVFLYGAVTTTSAIRLVKFILAVMSVMILVTLVDVLGMPSLGLVGEGAYGRLEGPVGGPNSYGVFFAVFIPVLIVSAMGFRNTPLRILYFMGAVAAVALLIKTGS